MMPHPVNSGISFSKKRNAITASDSELVRVRHFDGLLLPVVMEPEMEEIDLLQWAKAKRDFLDATLADAGAILFRNFKLTSVEQFQAFVEASCGQLLEYKERSSPRSQVSGNVFTSTDYPPDRTIFLHTEQSYNYTFPLRIAFCCMTEAAEGGETPVADTRRILTRLRPETRMRFERQGYLYVRNFGSGIGLSWQEAFQTEDPLEVEKHCRSSFIDFEWLSNERLRTRQRRPVVAHHPSGADAWFNHMAFFHVSTLEHDIRRQMLENFSEEDLPNNTYYGDGSSIEPETMEEIRAAYCAESTSFPWRTGDILLLDNVLTAHGRAPFVPPRKVVVAMARPCTWPELSHESFDTY
jgi:alpha-ketoglutarate-dependent taurine dioxygenase